MKKRILSLCLTLAMCLGLAVSASAAGETSVYADNGWDGFSGTFTFSKAASGTEARDGDPAELVYLLPVGTVITFRDANGDTGMKGWYDPGSGAQYFDSVKSFTVKAGNACVGGAYEDSPYVFVCGVNGAAKPAEPEKPAAPSFTDMKPGAYYEKPVLWAVDKGITAGTTATTFSPDNTCTRGQIITFLWRAMGSKAPLASAGHFSDVAEGKYYAQAAQWAYEQNMADGAAFAPDAPCTRAMAVEFLWKQAGAPMMAPAENFTDVPADASYAQAVAWALANGVTAGTSATTFSPDATCTRAQIVTFLYRGFGE